MLCPSCGAYIGTRPLNFCPQCGAPLGAEPADAAPAAEEAPAVKTPPPPSGNSASKLRRKKRRGKKSRGGAASRTERPDSLRPSPPQPSPPQPSPPQPDAPLEPFIPPAPSAAFFADTDKTEPRLPDETPDPDSETVFDRIVVEPPPHSSALPRLLAPAARKGVRPALVAAAALTVVLVAILGGLWLWASTPAPLSPKASRAAPAEPVPLLPLAGQAPPPESGTAPGTRAEPKPDLTFAQDAPPGSELGPLLINLPSLPANQQGRHNSAEIKNADQPPPSSPPPAGSKGKPL